jgi:hypothetical protein
MQYQSQEHFNSGDIIAIYCGLFVHYSIISDRLGPDLKPMLISASNRTGTVSEEAWNNVLSNEKTKHYPKPSHIKAYTILEKARSQIGSWSYSLTNRNCEHFVHWCTGFGISSKQVKLGAGLGIAAGLLTYACTKDHKALKATAGLIAGTVTGVTISKNYLR